MASLIRNRRIIEDGWQLLPPEAKEVPAQGCVIVPLALWREQREALRERGALGVWIEGHDDPASIAGDLAHFAVVAVHIAKFTDGRAFSTGRLLRERYGWRGELRAFGELLRDQLLFLERCGFDSFVLRENDDLQAALAAFGELTEQYQASALEPEPLFRRRRA